MFVEELIYSTLTSTFGGRIYPGVAADQSSPPYAVHSVPSTVLENTLADGASARHITVQIDIYDTTLASARALAKSVETALTALTGATAGVTLQMMQTAYDSDVNLHRVMLQFYFMLPRSGGIV